jgi:DNA-binding PadR family transcriptional regulator
MEKKRGVTKRGNNAQYEVLKLLQQGHTISDISKYRKVSRKSIYKVLKTINKKGWIRHPKRSFYEITQKGMEGLHSFVGLRYNFRQHNLHFKIKILESPKNWEYKRNELRQIPYFIKTIKLKNNDQDLFNYGRLQIKTTTKSVIIKCPTFYAPDWESAIIQAMGILEDNIPKIENMFKILLVKDYKANITIISQEYAKIQDSLAKLYRQEKNRLYVTGEDGKIWLITDFSFSTDETEYIHTEKATDDIDAIAPFFNDLRKNPTTISEMKEYMQEKEVVVNNLIHNELKHQKVLDEMLITLKKIQEGMEK